MKLRPKTKVKQDNQLGSDVLSYLFDQFHKDKRSAEGYDKKSEDGLDIPTLRERVDFAPSAAPALTNVADNGDQKLRLLNKFSSESKDTPFMRTPIKSLVRGYRDAIKSPIVDSLLTGGLVTAAGWGLSNYFNPIDDTAILTEVSEIAKKKGITPSLSNIKKLKAEAKSNLKRSKWYLPAALGLGALALNTAYHYDGTPESLYKFRMRKGASMPMHSMDMMPIGDVRSAVMGSAMTDDNKFLAMHMLNSIDKPYVSSTDIVDAAVDTGVSSVGSPIGRYTIAAAADAAVGYGIGSLLGMDNPGKLATATGIGSFLLRALQPAI